MRTTEAFGSTLSGMERAVVETVEPPLEPAVGGDDELSVFGLTELGAPAGVDDAGAVVAPGGVPVSSPLLHATTSDVRMTTALAADHIFFAMTNPPGTVQTE